MLDAIGDGDDAAAEQLFPLVYDELRAVAARCLQGERPDHTLQPTALVHEAYLKLVDQTAASFANRSQFFAVAATAMRRILVNHAKAKQRLKRGGGRAAQALDEVAGAFEARSIDLVALDEALDRLAAIDPDQARIVELRFFAGLTVDETAELLAVSPRTVHRDWSMARAWLRGEIAKGDPDDA